MGASEGSSCIPQSGPERAASLARLARLARAPPRNAIACGDSSDRENGDKSRKDAPARAPASKIEQNRSGMHPGGGFLRTGKMGIAGLPGSLKAVIPARRGKIGKVQRANGLPAQLHHVPGRGCGAVARPCFHELAPPFERVGPAVSPFGRVPDAMGQGLLGDFAGEACFVARPIAESRTEPVSREGRQLPSAATAFQTPCRKAAGPASGPERRNRTRGFRSMHR